MKYDKSTLAEVAKISCSISDVLRRLDVRWSGGTHAHVRNKLKQFGIDTSHFTGQGSNKGASHKGGHERKTSEQVLVSRLSGRREKAFRLRRALIESGVPHLCVKCGLPPKWAGLSLVLEVNHKDGNNINDSRENLEFLCPNCHSQIPNHRK